ncbi:MAG: HAMP domain-containing histidine kinase, partial [Burkholderiaceae bacterium]|nr:HAMP domain-containing histidine kinase [Burkholderiaceae bacterium]
GEVVVSLAMRANEAVVTVSDSGIGMTADEIDEVFEPYAQAQRSAGLSRGGLGIGLSLVRDIVEAHGGTVRASSPGRGLGSRFVVTLPVASNAAPMYAEAA